MGSISLEKGEVEVRERRLGSINGYEGSASELVSRCRNGSLKDLNRGFTQCMGCNSSNAFCQLSMIHDVAVINHAPVGCAGEFYQYNFVYRSGQRMRQMPKTVQGRYFNTNLTEKDTIFGAAEKLRDMVRTVYERVRPKAIFITTSCASGIIGDNVEQVAEEMTEETGIPVVYCCCDGFRTRVWTTGFDAAYHAIMRGIVKPPRERKKVINMINFWGSHVFDQFFESLGYTIQYLVPFASVETLEYISEATATIQICNTLGSYLAGALEDNYGVTAIAAPAGFGLQGTDAWFREIGRVLGEEARVEAFIKQEHERIMPEVLRYRELFTGKKAYVSAGAAHGHAIISLFRDFGFIVDGASIFHHDKLYDFGEDPSAPDSLEQLVNDSGDIKNYCVCAKQVFELTNTLNRVKPDLIGIRHGGLSKIAAQLGIPVVSFQDEQFIIGYEGILHFASKVYTALDKTELIENYTKHARLPYTKWWMEQKPGHYLQGGQE
jgi:nitrogenase molybdenum-iron protein alpha chain